MLLQGLPALCQTPSLQYDSSEVVLRQFDPQRLEAFRSDKDFIYEDDRDKIRKLSWWDRLMYRFQRFLFGQSKAGATFWEIVFYLLAIGTVVFLTFFILKIRPRTLFGKASKQLDTGFEEVDENIHEMDFEQLIALALKEKDYRRGVRLLYLETLKTLTLHGWIDWRPNKTNQEYQLELTGTPISREFDELTLNFEYVWYGDFPIDARGFERVQAVFRQFQQHITNMKARV